MRGVILVSLENASFHMVHVYTINWFKKVQNILITVLTLSNRPSIVIKEGGGG